MNIIEILELIREKIESINPLDDKFLRSRGNDNGFEELFPLILGDIITELPPTDILTFTVHLGHHFPDVDLILNGKKYGVELKSRNNGSWTTNGNSVFESISGDGYEDIFLFFGSKVPKENRLLVKYLPYWQATTNIKVTHSPRFTIDMLNTDDSVFESKEEYNSLRSMDDPKKIDFLQTYLKNNSIGAKWYTTPSETMSPIQFRDLTGDQKNQLTIELFILFIDDLLLGSTRTKYSRSAEYTLEIHYVTNRSFRDVFSSGGKKEFKNVLFPKVISTLASLRDPLIQTLQNASNDFFELSKEEWAKNLPQELITTNLYDSYTNILNYIGKEKTYSVLLEEANISSLSELILITNLD